MMKKLLCCALLAIASCTIVSAQNKGEMYVGGILGVSTTSVSTEGVSTSVTNFGIAPEFAYFVADRFRVGGSLAYNLASSDGQKTHTLTLGPSIAYYVRLGEHFYYTPELSLGFAYASTEGISGCGFAAGLALGALEFRPAPHWGVSLNLVSLQYATISYSDLNISSNATEFQLGISPTVGIKFYF